MELQQDYLMDLNKKNIECSDNINNIDDDYLESCFMFHVLEHLEDPIFHLKSIRPKLISGGKIIIEVLYARDF